jgi:hypothetical protein
VRCRLERVAGEGDGHNDSSDYGRSAVLVINTADPLFSLYVSRSTSRSRRVTYLSCGVAYSSSMIHKPNTPHRRR